jgi:hypothetical protein
MTNDEGKPERGGGSEASAIKSEPAESGSPLDRCRADPAIPRQSIGGFKFPLGVYPVEDLTPVPGYTLDFESADGGAESDGLEEWPDRYLFDAVLSVERVPNLVRAILMMMPTKVYPILDILGHDAFREIDPYVAFDPVGVDRVIEAIKQVPAFFYEDGLCGFGAMSEEPFFYFFVDEHKIVTIRAEAGVKEQIERLLASFDLSEHDDAAGVDAAAHEHRGVLIAPEDEPRLMSFDEIVEQLRDDWRLVLNIDPETNVDDEGNELGDTAWWCKVRVMVPREGAQNTGGEGEEESGEGGEYETKYAEVVLTGSCLREAEEESILAAERLAGLPSSAESPGLEDVEEGPPAPMVVFADRMTGEQLEEHRQKVGKRPAKGKKGEGARVWTVRWVE